MQTNYSSNKNDSNHFRSDLTVGKRISTLVLFFIWPLKMTVPNPPFSCNKNDSRSGKLTGNIKLKVIINKLTEPGVSSFSVTSTLTSFNCTHLQSSSQSSPFSIKDRNVFLTTLAKNFVSRGGLEKLTFKTSSLKLGSCYPNQFLL